MPAMPGRESEFDNSSSMLSLQQRRRSALLPGAWTRPKYFLKLVLRNSPAAFRLLQCSFGLFEIGEAFFQFRSVDAGGFVESSILDGRRLRRNQALPLCLIEAKIWNAFSRCNSSAR
jgi:hypothetical protein